MLYEVITQETASPECTLMFLRLGRPALAKSEMRLERKKSGLKQAMTTIPR